MDPRLEAMYRDLVKTRAAGTARPPSGPPVGVPPDSVFIRYLDQEDTELWQLPPVHRAAL